jgi:hypothetical protein
MPENEKSFLLLLPRPPSKGLVTNDERMTKHIQGTKTAGMALAVA